MRYLPFLLLFFSACRSQRPVTSLSHIEHIEHSLVAIGQTGMDSGASQTILQRMDASHVPGLSVAVFDSGHIIWARGYGLKDKASDQPVDTATLFQAASISKPVSSSAMFRLVEKNVLSPDEDVNIKLRRWKVPDNEFTATEKVTLRRIVEHMAGLGVHGFAGYNPTAPLPTLPQVLDGTPPANSPPVRVIVKPGTEEVYSGGGFVLMQLLMEDVTGRPFGALMNELVLQPAGMTQSSFDLVLPEKMAIHEANGYRENGEMVDGGHHVYPESAPAGLWTTPSDLARFMLNIGSSYRGSGGVLQQATARTMLTRVPGGGGQGFGLDGSGQTLRFRHNGGNAGFSCYAVSFAEIGRGVIIMTNSDTGDQVIRELVRAITREYGWSGLLHGE